MSIASIEVGTKGRRVYIGKLAGTGVFDPLGDQVGKIHDVVVIFRLKSEANVIGFVVEVGPRKRVFLPLTRVTAIESGSVITTGLLNIRSFTQRPIETLILSELFDRVVTMNDGSGQVRILDVAMRQRRPKDWVISTLHVQRVRTSSLGFTRSGETLTVDVSEVSGLLKTDSNQAATALVQYTEDMRPADLADFMHTLPQDRKMAVAMQLTDARLADVLEELGVVLSLSPEQNERVLAETGICFLFAQGYHKSMKNVAPVRKGMGERTIFNVLGPLSNPARATMQLLGVYDESLVMPMAQVLSNLGVTRGMVVCGGGIDEASLIGTNKVCEIRDGNLTPYELDPEKYGLMLCTVDDLRGGSPKANAQITRDILSGREQGAKREEILLNAGIALYLGLDGLTLADGIKKAAELIDSGATLAKLNRFAAATQEAAKA